MAGGEQTALNAGNNAIVSHHTVRRTKHELEN